MTTGAVLYVYYKVDPGQHEALAPRVRAFQARLQTLQPGLAGELLQRPGLDKGMETWMETYRHAGGLGDELVAGIDAAARAAGLPQPRHTESFIPLR